MFVYVRVNVVVGPITPDPPKRGVPPQKEEILVVRGDVTVQLTVSWMNEDE